MNAALFSTSVAVWCFIFDGCPTGRSDVATRRTWLESFYAAGPSRPLRAYVTYRTRPRPEMVEKWARTLGLVVKDDGPADILTAPGYDQV